VLDILTYVQEAASTKDENGIVHTAKIIWGASEKSHLGDALELVIIATRFIDDMEDKSDDTKSVMKAVIPPMTVPIQPKKSNIEENSTLNPTPQKPISNTPARSLASEPRPMLGKRNSRYDNIEAMLNTPAYQRRNVQFIVNAPTTSKETLKDETESVVTKPSENSLFD
jgi:hypothetical protein